MAETSGPFAPNRRFFITDTPVELDFASSEQNCHPERQEWILRHR
jgi:hypothetical protein